MSEGKGKFSTLMLCRDIASKAAGIIEEVKPDYFHNSEQKKSFITLATMAIDDCDKCHPLRLQDMLDSDDHGSLIHDVTGIVRNWDPATQSLEGNGWTPRYLA